MPGLKHAALLGLAAGDQSLFAPAAAPFAQLTAPVSAPAVAGPVYALGGDAITQPVAQPPVLYLACRLLVNSFFLYAINVISLTGSRE